MKNLNIYADPAFHPMTIGLASDISKWKYEPPYDLYNHDEGSSDELLCGDCFAGIVNDDLVGYLNFGQDARIPTVEKDVYTDDFIDIGLGLRPDICGRGFGLEFLLKAIGFASVQYGTNRFRLSVAAFNERAIKVYKKAGFEIRREVTHALAGKIFFIMELLH